MNAAEKAHQEKQKKRLWRQNPHKRSPGDTQTGTLSLPDHRPRHEQGGYYRTTRLERLGNESRHRESRLRAMLSKVGEHHILLPRKMVGSRMLPLLWNGGPQQRANRPQATRQTPITSEARSDAAIHWPSFCGMFFPFAPPFAFPWASVLRKGGVVWGGA
jgi:hypothetical protein